MKKMTLALFLASLSFGTANASCDTSFCGSLTLPQNPPAQMKNLVVCGNGTKTQTLTPAQIKNLIADNCTGDYCNDGGGVRG